MAAFAETTWAAHAHYGCEEGPLLERPSRGYIVADFDIGKRDVFAVLAKRGVFIDGDGLDYVVGAFDDNVRSIDGLHGARSPGFAKVCAGFLILFPVDDHDEDGTYGFGLWVFVADSGDHVSDVEVCDFDLIALLAKAGVGTSGNGVHFTLFGFDGNGVSGDGGDVAANAVFYNLIRTLTESDLRAR